MIGIMETVDFVLWTQCECLVHQAKRRRVHFALSWGMSRAKLLKFAEKLLKEPGQDVAEYAVMLVIILVLVLGLLGLIGTGANSVFSQIGSKIQ